MKLEYEKRTVFYERDKIMAGFPKDDIPWLSFPSTWKVKIIWPFAAAVCRFIVQNDHKAIISVYLDAFDCLGCMGKPYFEIYPGLGLNGDPSRFYLSEVDKMIMEIGEVGSEKDSIYSAIQAIEEMMNQYEIHPDIKEKLEVIIEEYKK